MIEYKKGDIFAEDADALVNPVNCQGVMGRGLALEFKNRWPENFQVYSYLCGLGDIRPGEVNLYDTMSTPRYIVNFPTKIDWRRPSRLEWIEDGLGDLAIVIRDRGIRSIAIPALGCGLGGLDWRSVRTRIGAHLGDLSDVRVVVFEPRE